MNKREVAKLKNGLYQIFWKDGSDSLAAIGRFPDGNCWLAPTNWIGGMPAQGTIWRKIHSVRLLISTDLYLHVTLRNAEPLFIPE